MLLGRSRQICYIPNPMFSGIIEEIGTVTAVKQSGETYRVDVTAQSFADKVAMGESIAINGVCLTAVQIEGETVTFDISSETLRRTSLSGIKEDRRVNIERSLKVGDRVNGHFVQGHVDQITAVTGISNEGNTIRFAFRLPVDLKAFIVAKGAVSIDGVSLTVGEVGKETFSVYVIPHTFEQTIFSQYKLGDTVNLEADCIARYVKGVLQDQ